MNTFVLLKSLEIMIVFSDNADEKTMHLIPEDQWTSEYGGYDADYISCVEVKYTDIETVSKSLVELKVLKERIQEARQNAIPKVSKLFPRKLEFVKGKSQGALIKADLPVSIDMVEFDTKPGLIPILETEYIRMDIGYEPWVQFAPKLWEEMIECVLKEMVNLWNEEHAKEDEGETKIQDR